MGENMAAVSHFRGLKSECVNVVSSKDLSFYNAIATQATSFRVACVFKIGTYPILFWIEN